MSYQYKESIMQHLGIHDDEEKRELENVYAKAEVLDEIFSSLKYAYGEVVLRHSEKGDE